MEVKNPRSFQVWLMASRPKTLVTALIPILVGTALADAVQGRVNFKLSLFAFLSALWIQIGTNLINDAVDFKKGADTSERLGPRRITQSGWVKGRSVLAVGLLCFLISAGFAIPLVVAGGWPLIIIGVLSMIAGYSYTAGPFPLAYLGLGDVFVLIFFGWVAVSGVYYLNTGGWDWPCALAGTQIGLLATVLIAINNLRDHVTDFKVQKKTLAVRMGPTWVRFEIAALILVPFFLGWIWISVGHGFKWALGLPLMVLPFALNLIRKIYSTEIGTVYNQFLAQGAAVHLIFGILLSIGLLIQ